MSRWTRPWRKAVAASGPDRPDPTGVAYSYGMRRSTQQADGPSPVPGPADDVVRVVDAVHGLPGRPLPGVQAEALARALGGCLEAKAVTIALWLPMPTGHDADAAAEHTVQEYRWPAIDAEAAVPVSGAAAVRLRDGEQVLADLLIEPPTAAERLRRWPELHVVTRLLVSDIQAQLVTENAERLIGQSTLLLADVRLRTAGEMEHQRYQLERDLHDGAQHHMVALQMSLAMVEHQLNAGDAAEAGRHLDRLRELLASTEEVLHTTATGLLAPLADHGLVAALTARLEALDTVTLDIDPELIGHRYLPEVEAAVYLACLEAVSNAHKHAPGAAVTLTLRTTSRGLSFEVADTGPGFDTDGRMPLRQLAARLASVEGTLTVRSSPTSGTRVSGFVAL
jgi:signal transduction histidine kinase